MKRIAPIAFASGYYWWFNTKVEGVRDILAHGDMRPVSLNTIHMVEGKIAAYGTGLHGSRRLKDAINFTNGTSRNVYLVRLGGDKSVQRDKTAARYRLYEKRIDSVAREIALFVEDRLFKVLKQRKLMSAADIDNIQRHNRDLRRDVVASAMIGMRFDKKHDRLSHAAKAFANVNDLWRGSLSGSAINAMVALARVKVGKGQRLHDVYTLLWRELEVFLMKKAGVTP